MNTRPADQFGLFDEPLPRPGYPHLPGSKERGAASDDAARKIAPSAAVLRAAVLAEFAAVGDAGLTADECATRLGKDELSIRPRCSELVADRQIIKTLARRPTRRGMTASVMRIAPAKIGSATSDHAEEFRVAQQYEADERERARGVLPQPIKATP